VKSAARILDVLELMAGLNAGIRLNELARQLDIPRSSASGLMSTLLQRGYVESFADGFRLAPNYRAAGWVGGATGALLRLSRPVMRRLADQTEESAFLGMPVADTCVRYVAKEVGSSPISYDIELDVTRQAYSTSIGMVVLAGMDDAALAGYFKTHPLELITPHTTTDEARIRQGIDLVRKQGYATMVDTNVLGVSGVAVPVTANGAVLAGLAVIAPTSRFDPRRDHIVQRTVAAAREISAALERP
jgi:IclR family acetate operon transcriptional repressor